MLKSLHALCPPCLFTMHTLAGFCVLLFFGLGDPGRGQKEKSPNWGLFLSFGGYQPQMRLATVLTKNISPLPIPLTTSRGTTTLHDYSARGKWVRAKLRYLLAFSVFAVLNCLALRSVGGFPPHAEYNSKIATLRQGKVAIYFGFYFLGAPRPGSSTSTGLFWRVLSVKLSPSVRKVAPRP